MPLNHSNNIISSWKSDEFAINEIVTLIKNKKLTVPQYQRRQIWSDKKQLELIESIKSGFPFGSILLYQDSTENSNFHLIDGLQRCTTFYRFITNPGLFFDKNIDILN